MDNFLKFGKVTRTVARGLKEKGISGYSFQERGRRRVRDLYEMYIKTLSDTLSAHRSDYVNFSNIFLIRIDTVLEGNVRGKDSSGSIPDESWRVCDSSDEMQFYFNAPSNLPYKITVLPTKWSLLWLRDPKLVGKNRKKLAKIILACFPHRMHYIKFGRFSKRFKRVKRPLLTSRYIAKEILK